MQSFGSNRTQPNSGPSRPTDEEIIKLAGALPDELQEVLFGPKSLGLGLDAYLRDADPKSGAPASAIRQVLDRFPSDRVPDLNTAMIPYGNDTLKARRDMWDKFAKLADAVQADLSDNILETVFQKLTELSPLAKNELEGRKGLCVHLQEVMESLRGLLFGETMPGRFPGVVTDRQGLLEIYVAGPLHDSLKYLADKDDQVVPDHEVMIAALIRDKFVGKRVTIGEEVLILTKEDVEFLAGVVGNHENLFKEAGRTDWIRSDDPINRGRALFFVADVLTGVFEPKADGSFSMNHTKLEKRLGDLYFRHIDLVEGKVFRPQWGENMVRDLVATLTTLQQEHGMQIDTGSNRSVQEVLCETALGAIRKAWDADNARRQNTRGPLFSDAVKDPETGLGQMGALAKAQKALEQLRKD